MNRSGSERKIIAEAIDEWQSSGVLDPDGAAKLRDTITNGKNQQTQLAQYFFIIAVSCGLLAAGALFLDDRLLERLRKNFLLSNYTIAFGAAILAGISFYIASKRSIRSTQLFSEANLIPGSLLSIIALVYACKEWGGGVAYSFFLGLNTLLFCSLAGYFRSKALWIIALLSSCGWVAAFTTAFSKSSLYWGLNYPARFAVFGLLIMFLSKGLQQVQRLQFIRPITWHCGLLVFYTAMWGISIFGNYADLEQWQQVRQEQVLIYGVIFGVISAIGLYLGIRRDDDALRDYSVLFLLLNLYTRYFEYFWDSLNKGLFFLVLALSFGLLGRWLVRRAARKSTIPAIANPESGIRNTSS